ncbi:MAG: hypothetical protein EOP48_14845, partial [Sphingobacteriales bacterium]
MAVIEINIDFRQYVSHLDLIKDLSQAFAAVPGDEVRISIDLTTYAKYLYSDFLLLVVSVVNHLRRSDIEVKGKVVKTNWNDDKFKYAMRVDFFNLIGAEVPEDFVRHDGSGKFTEISEFDQNSIYPL